MSCEILDHVNEIDRKAASRCQEQCKVDYSCPFVDDDRFFPKIIYEDSEEEFRVIFKIYQSIEKIVKSRSV